MSQPESRPPSRTQLLRERARQNQGRDWDVSDRPDRRRERQGGWGALRLWEADQRGRFRRAAWNVFRRYRDPAGTTMVAVIAFVAGIQLAARPEGSRLATLEAQVDENRVALQARKGELELVRLEMSRIQEIVDYSRRYSIPADLAATINDIALAEGIAPELAFRLVQIESGFYRRAVSPKGAVGLAQVMPATAYDLDPSLEYDDLFDRDTNLRPGFRYLRWLMNRYDGDLRLALLAYNRGLGTVDSIRAAGGDPANGYATAVLGAIGGPDH